MAGLLCLRGSDGSVVSDEGWRWLGAPGDEDERLLDLVVAPVLDIGCGPWRHLRALVSRGVEGLGLDVTPSVVRLARAEGLEVLEGSIFGPVPASGAWGSALLLDGNIGIGADPVALLRRVAILLRPGGRLLVELDPPGRSTQSRRVRLEHEASSGPWFDWARRRYHSHRRAGGGGRGGLRQVVDRGRPLVRPSRNERPGFLGAIGAADPGEPPLGAAQPRWAVSWHPPAGSARCRRSWQLAVVMTGGAILDALPLPLPPRPGSG